MSDSDRKDPELEEPGRREPDLPDGEVSDEAFPEEDFPEVDAGGEGGLDDVDVRDLLRGALRPPRGSVAPALLGGVQKKLRARSAGKFYGDGWSTAEAPRSTYIVTSALMLLLILIVAILLVPWEAVGL